MHLFPDGSNQDSGDSDKPSLGHKATSDSITRDPYSLIQSGQALIPNCMWIWDVVLSVSIGLHGPKGNMGCLLKEIEKFYSQKKEKRMMEKRAKIKFPLQDTTMKEQKHIFHTFFFTILQNFTSLAFCTLGNLNEIFASYTDGQKQQKY